MCSYLAMGWRGCVRVTNTRAESEHRLANGREHIPTVVGVSSTALQDRRTSLLTHGFANTSRSGNGYLTSHAAPAHYTLEWYLPSLVQPKKQQHDFKRKVSGEVVCRCSDPFCVPTFAKPPTAGKPWSNIHAEICLPPPVRNLQM